MTGAALSVVGNILATSMLSLISHHNYPGGVAFSQLHRLISPAEGK